MLNDCPLRFDFLTAKTQGNVTKHNEIRRSRYPLFLFPYTLQTWVCPTLLGVFRFSCLPCKGKATHAFVPIYPVRSNFWDIAFVFSVGHLYPSFLYSPEKEIPMTCAPGGCESRLGKINSVIFLGIAIFNVLNYKYRKTPNKVGHTLRRVRKGKIASPLSQETNQVNFTSTIIWDK